MALTLRFNCLQTLLIFGTTIEPIGSYRFVVTFRQVGLQLVEILRNIDGLQQLVRDVSQVRLPWALPLKSEGECLIDTVQTGQLIRVDLKQLALDELVAVRPRVRVDLDHQLDHLPDIIRVVVWDPGEGTLAHPLE